jgi:hypothetical protein
MPSVRFYVDTALGDLRDRINEFLKYVPPADIINVNITTKNDKGLTEYIAVVVLTKDVEAYSHITT